jgi:hypothetical protein
MPRLDKHTNGHRPEQPDLLHATGRYSNIAQVASAKDKRPPRATALQEPSHATNGNSLHNGKNLYMAKVSTLIYPSTLMAELAEKERRPSTPICEKAATTTSRSGRTRREKRDPFKYQLLSQFGFQPFKKCFYGKCTTIFVPGDFKPSSPRRMFCSTKCFEAHWRQKLFRYLEKNLNQEVDIGTANSETPLTVNPYVSL